MDAVDSAIRHDQIDTENFPVRTLPDGTIESTVTSGGEILKSAEDYKKEKIANAESEILSNSDIHLLKTFGNELRAIKEKSASEILTEAPLQKVFEAAGMDQEVNSYVDFMRQVLNEQKSEAFNPDLYDMGAANLFRVDDFNPTEEGAPLTFRIHQKDNDLAGPSYDYAVKKVKRLDPSLSGDEIPKHEDFAKFKKEFINANPPVVEFKMDAVSIGSDDLFQNLAGVASTTQRAIGLKFDPRVKKNYSTFADEEMEIEKDLQALSATYENMALVSMMHEPTRQQYVRLQSSLMNIRDLGKPAEETYVTQTPAYFKKEGKNYLGYEIEWNYDPQLQSYYFTPIRNVYDSNYNIINSKTQALAPQYIGNRLHPSMLYNVDAMYGTGSMKNIKSGFFKNDFVPLVFMQRGIDVSNRFVESIMR
jgi:hypothetical protein